MTTELQGVEGDNLTVECDYKPGVFISRYSVEWTYETTDGQREFISLDFNSVISKSDDGLDLVPSDFSLVIKHLNANNATATCVVFVKGQHHIYMYVGKTNMIGK